LELLGLENPMDYRQQQQQQQQVWQAAFMGQRCILVTASSDRRHYRNIITIFDGGRFFLQVANVVIIQVDIHKRP